MFYSADELTGMLEDIGYRDVGAKTLLAGMIGFHRASKAS
jgi:demethylmenaquinone methyltransferase/2-methoxy-6-polyprenyl-1,4-benzoquinol methylase